MIARSLVLGIALRLVESVEFWGRVRGGEESRKSKENSLWGLSGGVLLAWAETQCWKTVSFVSHDLKLKKGPSGPFFSGFS